MMANLAHGNSEVEDISCAVLRFASGALGQVTSSVLHHGQEQQLVLQAERARVSYPWRVAATRGKENGFPEHDAATEEDIQRSYDALPDLAHEGHRGQVDNVLTAIEGRGRVLVDGTEGRRTMEVITAIYKAAITGQPVLLPISPDDVFYRRNGVAQNAPRFHRKTGSVTSFADEEISLMDGYRR
jgi:predicted dehydrogenase